MNDISNKRLYHGSDAKVKVPRIIIGKYAKDFGNGFYCTLLEEQAIRWAKRFGNIGILNIYTVKLDNGMNIKIFDKMTDEWLDFIALCRNGGTHQYDVVEGPMADDQIFNYVNEFIRGGISRAAFWELAKFSYPTHQISFNTEKAVNALNFEGWREV